jgi:hypothetical protein
MNQFGNKILSPNGWIATVILIMCVFSACYYYVFPKLANQNQGMFYRQVKIADKKSPLQVEASIPQYLTDFQEGKLIINIACGNGDACNGSLELVSFLDKDGKEILNTRVTFKRLDIKDQPTVIRNLYINYDLKANEIMSVPVSVQISSRNGDYVAFSIYDTMPTGGLPVGWGDYTCGNRDNTQICASTDDESPWKVLQQSGVENLLLPPWSNRLIPFIVFAMVWLAEQGMPQPKNKDEQPAWSKQPNLWMLCLMGFGACFLLLFYAVLYFSLLTETPLIAVLFAICLVSCIIALPKLFS